MIRTHRPRGQHWTCASHFQQSKQYRNLDAESSEKCSGKTLVVDPDDAVPDAYRAAKRRKIESLANGFLDGKPLFISSASSNGPDLTASVENVLHERRLGWDEVLDDHDDHMWANGEDGWDFLRKRSQQRVASKPPRDGLKEPRRTSEACRFEFADVEHTPHASKRSRMESRAEVSIAPSEDALARAAELRARKAWLGTGIAGIPDQLRGLSGHLPHSAPPTAKAPSSFRECSSSRPFNLQTPSETTMADELRLSRTDSPSHRPRAFTVPAVSFGSETTVEDPSSNGDGDGALRSLHQVLHAPQDPSAPPMNTGSTAMEICTAEQNRKSSCGQAPGVWTPINTKHASRDIAGIDSSRRMGSSLAAAAEKTLHESAIQDVTRSSRMRSTKSAQKVSTRSLTKSNGIHKATPSKQGHIGTSQDSSQSQLTRSFQASKTKSLLQAKPQNGSTPFVYRRKTKVPSDDRATPAETLLMQEKQEKNPQAPEIVSTSPEPNEPTTLPPISAVPPTLDMSFQNCSSIAPNLHMALVDGQLHERLPSCTDLDSGTISVRKALGSDKRSSGTEFSRGPPEHTSPPPPHENFESSLQLKAPRPEDAVENNEGVRPQRRSTGQWPGTQVLLNQAQYDLFISPEKIVSATADTGSEIHDHENAVSQVQAPDDTRHPLQQLTQEHLPGTQVLMDNWSPWSTVKKPKKRASFAPTPLISKEASTPAGAEGRLPRSDTERSHASERVRETEPRRSSLRFARSTIETPMPSQQKAPKATALPLETSLFSSMNTHSPRNNHAIPTPSHDFEHANTEINLDLSNFSFAATNAQTFADVGDSMMDWSSRAKLSDFQNAQREGVDPAPEQTLADLATEILSTADIDGVLGRV